MDKFCILTNTDKDKNYETSMKIKQYLESKGKNCIITKDHTNGIGEYTSYTDVSEIPKDTECAIVLGGDGTFIQAANDMLYWDIPIIGINLGTLGYLTEIEKQNIIPAFEKLFRNEYKIESRMMLKGSIQFEETMYSGVALNDIVISKGGSCRLITVKVYVNEEFMDSYIGDGVIISTPTGSTGYNLSAGGPIVAPELQAMIITPICPHSLNKRSLVLSAKDKIRLEVGRSKQVSADEAVVTLDGRVRMQMQSGDKIKVRKSSQETKILKLTDASFVHILRNKIGKEKE